MLAASIKAERLEANVRIRNLSESGAMIEGAVLPLPKTHLLLRRLDMETDASVIWLSAGRCGIEFDRRITVEDWVSGKAAASLPQAHGQQRVDAIQAAARAGATPRRERQPQGQDLKVASDLSGRVASELAYAQRLLDTIAQEFARDPLMVQRHGTALQNLDMVGQLILHLSAVVGAADPLAVAGRIALDDLRSRLVGKSIF